MAAESLLIARTAHHRYAVRRSEVASIALIGPEGATHHRDERGQPYIGVELGPMLDPHDHSTRLRKRALLVPLRRRIVALLVDGVEMLPSTTSSLPLPALLRHQLRHAWAISVVTLEDEVIVQLDLREVARNALLDLQSNRT